MEYELELNSDFFVFLSWVTGGLRHLCITALGELNKLPETPEVLEARKDMKIAISRSKRGMEQACENIVEQYPFFQSTITQLIMQECSTVVDSCAKNSNTFSTARNKLQDVFGLKDEACALCEFVFIKDSFAAVERYFEDHLEIHKYGNKRLFSAMLDMTPAHLWEYVTELTSCGIFDTHRFLSLHDDLVTILDGTATQPDECFCRILEGKSLPLKNFRLSWEDISQVVGLLTQPGNAPVHILLYGSPGTGKTIFAKSIAAHLGVKAWAVSSRVKDNDGDRRASLTACLHIAAKHTGAFVLADEAERLLDTSIGFGKTTKDKAWLNDFLEQPGRRIIWITNHIEHIDQAVLRRFSHSIYFEDMGIHGRKAVWRQILTDQKATSRLSEKQIETLVENYPVPAAVMEKSILQAKQLTRGKKDFFAKVECSLRAHVTLSQGGNKPRIKPQASTEFTLDGVSLESSAQELLENCRRIDALLRGTLPLRPGGGTMLFYGPPGTGKTALARYIAKELNRECIVKKASDLLSMWVGGTEQNIARAFRQAADDGAVLVVDEADSFIYSRDMVQRSWETTAVNEFLTGLEECRSFCICTTNRRDNMDAASMRRFSFKIPFTYANPKQIAALYDSLLAPLVKNKLKPEDERDLCAMPRLTPGDFHAVRSQYWLTEPGLISHKELINGLRNEQKTKLEESGRRIGF
jgi:SpoVK/Ycf46/Vps4 family AAA+-type ATPase